MKSSPRKILTGLVIAVLFCAWSVTAFAADAPDLTQEGSISVSMQYEQQAVPGGNLTIYHVGELQENNGQYTFVGYGDFAECGYSLNDVKSQTLVNQLADYIGEENIEGDTVTIAQDGSASFDGLEPGLYLLTQTKAADGYEKVAPFLVTIPLTVDGEYTYDVDATPKLTLTATTPDTPSTPDKPSNTPDKPSNTPKKASSLPKTGQLIWPIPVLAVAGLLLFAMGWKRKYGK